MIIEAVSVGQGCIALHLVKGDNVVLGFVQKHPPTLTERTPWQAFKAICGQGGPPRMGELLDSFYGPHAYHLAIERLKKEK